MEMLVFYLIALFISAGETKKAPKKSQTPVSLKLGESSSASGALR